MLTRYSIQEMLTSNVNRIMTQTISIHHQGYLMRAYKEGVLSIMYKEQRNFVIDKMGFSTPISLLVKPMYVIAESKFQYISYLQPLPTNSAFILASSQGLVESFSEPIGRLLGLDPKWVVDRKIYLQAFIPMLIDFFVEKEYRNMGQLENIDVDRSNLAIYAGQLLPAKFTEDHPFRAQRPTLLLLQQGAPRGLSAER